MLVELDIPVERIKFNPKGTTKGEGICNAVYQYFTFCDFKLIAHERAPIDDEQTLNVDAQIEESVGTLRRRMYCFPL